MNGIVLKNQLIDFIRVFDPALLVITLLLVVMGVTNVYSASYSADRSAALPQFWNFAVAFVVMWTFAYLSPERLMRFALPLYVLGVALLIAVMVTGTVVNGSRRWLSLGFTRFQPAEVMKLAMPLLLAWYFHRLEAVPNWRHYGVSFLLILVPCALIAKQPDLGTAILIGSAGFYVVFFAGFPWAFMVAIATAIAVASPILWGHLHDYQQKRIMTLFDPNTDPQGAGYHIIQSTIAIGSGGWFGKGFLHGTQTHLEFIPEKHTDFIFAVFAEEWGWMGAWVLLALYLSLIIRGAMIAASAQLFFSKLLAGSITFSFFTYVFVNIGMVSGILPVVGVPLPFFSYGGTSLVIMFMGVGILMSIHKHRLLIRR